MFLPRKRFHAVTYTLVFYVLLRAIHLSLQSSSRSRASVAFWRRKGGEMKNERKRSKYAGIRSNNVSGQGNMEREDFLIKRLCWHFAVGIPLTSINNDLCNYFAFFLFQDQSSGTLLPPRYLRGTVADFDICSTKDR